VRIKVSRYPRATMPPELKNRFEVGKKSPEKTNTLYNDEFWRDAEKETSPRKEMPFF
jgi:hypothetical protein